MTETHGAPAGGGKRPRWTREEDRIVAEMYPGEEIRELLRALPRRNEDAVRTRAKFLGVRRRNALGRAAANRPPPAPRPPRDAPPLQARACLRCGEDFASEGAHHRICKACKTTAAWREGAGTGACETGWPGGRLPALRGCL